MSIADMIFGGHSCKKYFPKSPKVGDKFTCMCGAEWTCTRTFPWAKWE